MVRVRSLRFRFRLGINDGGDFLEKKYLIKKTPESSFFVASHMTIQNVLSVGEDFEEEKK